MKAIIRLEILSLLIFATSTMAQQGLDNGNAAATGNRELPNVLYIVPWKSTESIDIPSPPIKSIMDQTLLPIERNEFRRQIRYHDMFFNSSTNSEISR